jgi:hypothetical protein
MRKSRRGRENELVTQYREVVPVGYRPDFFEHEDFAQSGQVVISQNYTTYSVGEMPVPVLANLRLA